MELHLHLHLQNYEIKTMLMDLYLQHAVKLFYSPCFQSADFRANIAAVNAFAKNNLIFPFSHVYWQKFHLYIFRQSVFL